MKKSFFILFFLPFSLISQNKDIIVIEGKKYKGTLLDYSIIDIKNKNSGHLTFFIDRIGDTVKINTDSNYRLKLKKSYNFYEFDKKSWNNIEFGLNFLNRFSANRISSITVLVRGSINSLIFFSTIGQTGISNILKKSYNDL